ncbi:MAG: metallophosphoesterase [Simkaniaceae bacterium]|nr:metallophosphoesterase [Simkaniaceae bacterium]
MWAIADLHLSFGVQGKSMDVFGPAWKNFTEKIEKKWKALVKDDDLVLIAGDISWAMKLDDVLPDLAWIDALPGKKILLKGNHDYWWPSNAKLKNILPSSIDFIQGNALVWNGVAIGGARLWDTPEFNYNAHIDFIDNPSAKEKIKDADETRRIFTRDLQRLENSLKQLDPTAKTRIALTHYPPIGPQMQPTTVSKILENYEIDICLFGHLHNLKKDSKLFGEMDGINYICTAADYIDFTPVKVM